MKLLLLALLVGVCYSAPSQPEMSAGFGTEEQGPERVDNFTLADRTCQPHARRVKCSSGCPPTCQHPQSMCMVMICDNRCVCNEGYVLDGDDRCVLLQDCQGYDPDANLGFDEERDPEETEQLDSVEPGASESDEEDAMLPMKKIDTPDNCAANQVYKECGTACPKTCANPDGSLICEEMCVIGCQCDEGYFQASDKSCVKIDDCY